MKPVRIFLAASLAIATSLAFAQDLNDQAMKQKVADIAARFNENKDSNREAVALEEFLKVAKDYPDALEVNSWLGFLYLRTDNAPKAIFHLEKASTANPKDVEIINNLGNAYMKAKDNKKALATFEKLTEMDPTRYQAFYNIGNYYLENKEYGRAVTAFTKAADLQKDRPQILNNLGVAYESLKNYEKASAIFMKASDLEPRDQTYAKNAGTVLHRIQKFAPAATYLERALTNGSRDKEVIITLADCYSNLKKPEKVSKLYVDYAGALSSEPDYYYNLGLSRLSLKDYAGAESAFRKSYQLRDTDKDCLLNLGALLFQRGEYEEARLMFEKLMGLEPSVRNKKNFAAAASRSGDTKAALPVWNDVLKTNPNDLEVRLLVADAVYDDGDYKTAMNMYKAVLAIKPKSATALDGIGRCQIATAEYAAAEASLRSAIQADPKFVQAYNNLAVVFEKQNKRKEAIALLEKAASMEPNNADVLKNLKRMKSAG